MNISPVSVAFTPTQNGQIVFTEPAGCNAGDLLVVFIEEDTSLTGAWPSQTGWTQYDHQTVTYDGDDYVIYYRNAQGNGASYTFTIEDSFSNASLVCLAYRGTRAIDASTPTTNNSGNSHPVTATASSVTTLSPNSIILALLGTDYDTNFNAESFTAPSGYRLRASQFNNRNASCAAAEKLLAAQGASGSAAWTVTSPGSSGASGWCAYLLAISPDLTGGVSLENAGTIGGTNDASTASSDHTVAPTQTVGASGLNRCLLALVTGQGVSVGVSGTPTFNGTNGTKLTSTLSGTNVVEVWWWSDNALPSAAGTYTASVTVDGASGTAACTLLYFEKAAQSAPTNFGSATGTGTSITASMTSSPAAKSYLAAALLDITTTDAAVEGANQLPTSGVNGTSTGNTHKHQTSAKYIPSAGASSMSWSGLTNATAKIAVAVEVLVSPVVVDHTPLQPAPFQQSKAAAPRRIYDVAAPVGALMAGGLSSIGWGPSVPQSAPLVPKAIAPQVTAPVGTGTFALPKLGHALAIVHPPRALAPNRPALEAYAPVGSPLGAQTLPSLGWLQVDGTPPASRSLVISATFGEELQRLATPLTSLGWLVCDPPPRGALVTAKPSESAPVNALRPFVSASTGWFPADYRTPPLVSRRVEPSAPTGPLTPFVSPSTGWMGHVPVPFDAPLTPPRPVDSSPVGQLLAGQLANLGWMGAVPLPFDAPLVPPRQPDASPVGPLLTPQSFGWNAAHQERPAPVIARKVEPAAPIGTPFAIALPSNGWLATDNPRTPLKLGRSTPVDPVGNLLVLPPLPSIGWLATDNPRTPYTTKRAVVVDPVGSKFFVPPALGPFWFSDPSPRAPAPAPTQYAVAPVGSPLVSTLTSLGWLTTPQPATQGQQSPRVAPSEQLGPLLFGGSPWAGLATPAARLVAPRQLEPSAPVGSPLASAGLTSFGWFTAEVRPQAFVPRQVCPTAPVGSPLGPTALASLGWIGTELERRTPPPRPTLPPAQHFGALAFGGAPWTSVDVVRALRPNPPTLQPSIPVGAFFPPPAPSQSVAWMQVMDLPPRAQVFTPMAVEIGSPVSYPLIIVALFTVPPSDRCSPIYPLHNALRQSPEFEVNS